MLRRKDGAGKSRKATHGADCFARDATETVAMSLFGLRLKWRKTTLRRLSVPLIGALTEDLDDENIRFHDHRFRA
jgi:hypothetical protein